MSDTNTFQILEAIKESGDRQERAMASLGGDIRRLLEVVVARPDDCKLPHQQANGNGKKETNFTMLTAVAAIIFGLMAPMYVMLESVSNTVSTQTMQMHKDDDRERNDAAAMARVNGSLREIETQFDGIRIAMDKDEYHDARGDAKVEDRLDQLEQRVFKIPSAYPPSDPPPAQLSGKYEAGRSQPDSR